VSFDTEKKDEITENAMHFFSRSASGIDGRPVVGTKDPGGVP
jgi:hypothetical protein